MFGFGKRDRRAQNDGLPAFDHRYFITNDARCYAPDDLHLAPLRVSGTGLVPLMDIGVLEPVWNPPFLNLIIGLGGTRSPVSTNIFTPLSQPLSALNITVDQMAGVEDIDYG